MSGDFHPMSLGFKVAVHRRYIESWVGKVSAKPYADADGTAGDIPEYPQKPVAHLKRPTAMRAKGKITHCEVDFFAGHRNAANGYGGVGVLDLDFDTVFSEFLDVGLSSCFLLRGL